MAVKLVVAGAQGKDSGCVTLGRPTCHVNSVVSDPNQLVDHSLKGGLKKGYQTIHMISLCKTDILLCINTAYYLVCPLIEKRCDWVHSPVYNDEGGFWRRGVGMLIVVKVAHVLAVNGCCQLLRLQWLL